MLAHEALQASISMPPIAAPSDPQQPPVMHFLERTHKRRKWLPHEDSKLIQQVARIGKNWAVIATHLPGRDGPGCRKRYVYYLEPNIYRGAWTPEEDALLIRSFGRYGKQWAQIAQVPELSRRSTRSLSWRWAKLSQKKEVAELVTLAAKQAQARGLIQPTELEKEKMQDEPSSEPLQQPPSKCVATSPPQPSACGPTYLSQLPPSAFQPPLYPVFCPMFPSPVFPSLPPPAPTLPPVSSTRVPLPVRAVPSNSFGSGPLSGSSVPDNLLCSHQPLAPPVSTFSVVPHSQPPLRTGAEAILFERPRDGTSFRPVWHHEENMVFR
jgi:hypothetical protein